MEECLTLDKNSLLRCENLALCDIKAKLNTIFDTMSDGLIVIDEAGAIQLFSSGAERLFGYRQDEVLGANVKILTPSPYREAHDGYLAAYRDTGVKKIIGIGREVSGRRKDGSVFPMYLSIGEIWLEEGQFFVGVAHDLTRLKHAEERLLTLSAAVEQSPAAVMISDKDGRIEYVNRCFIRLTGYDADELIGQNPRVLHSNHTAQDQYRRLWETIRGGREWRGEIQDRKKNGELYWALETITPMRDARGETHALPRDPTGHYRTEARQGGACRKRTTLPSRGGNGRRMAMGTGPAGPLHIQQQRGSRYSRLCAGRYRRKELSRSVGREA